MVVMSLPLVPTFITRAAMRLRFTHLRHHARVFRHLTGLSVPEFDILVADLLPAFTAAEQARLSRPTRQRAIGGGRQVA